jgi:phosphopantetheine adenylyltransferase
VQRAPFQHAAVGGTFDRLHSGHRNLLAAAALVCVGTLYVGIAGDQLLRAKANASFIQPFEAREAAVLAFLHAVRPSLHVVTKGLLNADPPLASTMEAVRARCFALPCLRRCLPAPYYPCRDPSFGPAHCRGLQIP